MLEAGVASDRRAKPLGATMGGGGCRASGGAKAVGPLVPEPRGTVVTRPESSSYGAESHMV